jgi:phenylalanyl-tRNA synthetase beta chain
MCIAGVYGGQHSGISASTTNVFLESASFNQKDIRRTSMRHNLRTDAALHFEKGTDPHQVLYALNRAAGLIQEICGGKVSGNVMDVNYLDAELRLIDITYAYINNTIGVQMPAQDIDRILTATGFKIIKKEGETLHVQVPTYKLDVTQAADVVEEILRIYGLDNVPVSKQVSFTPVPVTRTRDQWRNLLSNYLVAHGFCEIINNSIVNSSRFADEENQVKLVSYKNAGLDSLRMAMLPSVLDTLAYNQKRRVLSARVFEFGRIYSVHEKTTGTYIENEQLILAVMGDVHEENWLDKSTPADWKLLKPLVEQCLRMSGINKWEIITENDTLHYRHGTQTVAEIAAANKAERTGADLKGMAWYAVLHADLLFPVFEGTKPRYKEPSRFPSIRRDIAMLIDENVMYSQIEQVTKDTGGKYLQHMQVFDVYHGDKIEAGKKSYAVSLEFNNPAQSMQDNDVNKHTDKVKEALIKQLGAHIR